MLNRVSTTVLVSFFLLFLTCDVFSFNMEISARTFYSRDYLRWSIPSSDIDIRSELTWRNIEVVGFAIESEFLIKDRYYLNLSFNYGFILFGSNQDSDYNLGNRQAEFSRSINNAGDGNVMGASLSFGEPIYFTEFTFTIIPLIGFLFKRQELKMFEGYQVLSDGGGTSPGTQPLPTGPIYGLDSSYTTNWFGIWFGLDFDYKPFSFWSISFLMKLSALYYYAYANWNLRTDFAHPTSFIHQSVGFGNHISVRNYFYVSDYISFDVGVFFDGMFCGKEGFTTAIDSGGLASNGLYSGVISTSFGIDFGFNTFF